MSPTPFDALRFGYFDIALGNMLKSIRGGANPIGVMTLAMCSVRALSEIEWAINNQQQLEPTGELKPMSRQQKNSLSYVDKVLFEGWLNRWVRDSSINPNCDAAKTYGVRCSLVHTSGASETLNRSGVKAWLLTVGRSIDHYKVTQQDVPRINLEMPDFIAELMLAMDQFLVRITQDPVRQALENAQGALSKPEKLLPQQAEVIEIKTKKKKGK